MITLTQTIESVTRLTREQYQALKKLKLTKVEDLLRYYPVRYGDVSKAEQIETIQKGVDVTVFGRIKNLTTSKGFKTKIPMAKAILEDETGTLGLVWFNQPYIAKLIHNNSLVRVDGKLSVGKNGRYFSNPKIEEVDKIPEIKGSSLFATEKDLSEISYDAPLYPVYPETKYITSNWIFHTLQRIFKSGTLDQITDPIPEDILKKYSLPSLKTALLWIHTPHKIDDYEIARKRLAFEEVFFIQLRKQIERKEIESMPSIKIDEAKEYAEEFTSKLPFQLTKAQRDVIGTITDEMARGVPMSRLLEGDVGSGKTAVAGATAYAVVKSHPNGKDFGNYQIAYMAPTEILATQQFESFIEFFKHLPIEMALVTGTTCKKFPSKVNPTNSTNVSKAQMLKWIEEGKISLIIGTHALIQKKVKFKNLTYVIIDEQHRFGVKQRQALVRRKDTESTRKDAEKVPESSALIYKDLTYAIRDVLFNVRKELGGGHKESIYQKAAEEEFKNRGIKFSKECRIPINYKNKNVGTYIPDFVIEDKIILEFKALPYIGTREEKQLWNYLKGSDYKLALLVNFGSTKLEIKRIVYDTARSSASIQRSSAYLPHLLSMTATPIPRTLALTIYGDLDLSILDQMPAGRKQIITDIITPEKRAEVYEKIRSELNAGRQAYIICPRIDAPDPDQEKSLQLRSVKEEAARLKKEVFQEFKIDILHSKMTPTEKDKVMTLFYEGKTDILVSTSVVEVGVNVPNATVIVIEGAERFGLSQLHQLRGRVLRGNHQPYCFVFADSKSDKSIERLRAFKSAKNGFELAELDLKQRGSGSLAGGKQWGVSDIAMEALRNIRMVEAARTEARTIATDDMTLSKHPTLKKFFDSKKEIHFE